MSEDNTVKQKSSESSRFHMDRKTLADFTCERCGKDLKPDCKNWRCEYVRQAKAFERSSS